MVLGKAFIYALFSVILTIVWLYKWIILIRALLSWVNPDPYNPVVRFFVGVTEPVLRPLRRIIPPYRTGGLDFSPVLAFLILYFIELFVRYILMHFGRPVWG